MTHPFHQKWKGRHSLKRSVRAQRLSHAALLCLKGLRLWVLKTGYIWTVQQLYMSVDAWLGLYTLQPLHIRPNRLCIVGTIPTQMEATEICLSIGLISNSWVSIRISPAFVKLQWAVRQCSSLGPSKHGGLTIQIPDEKITLCCIDCCVNP